MTVGVDIVTDQLLFAVLVTSLVSVIKATKKRVYLGLQFEGCSPSFICAYSLRDTVLRGGENSHQAVPARGLVGCVHLD